MELKGSVKRYQDLDAQALAIAVFKDEKATKAFLASWMKRVEAS